MATEYATVAKLIRSDLKTAFPGVKFGVTSQHSVVNIRWSAGPTTSSVRELVGKYKAGSFDGSIDSYVTATM